VYAVGDIHGRADLLEELHQAIETDAAERTASRQVIVYLGDYVSRARQGRRVIDMLRGPGPFGFDRVPLMGNHEYLVLRFLEGDLQAGAQWLDHGGDALLEEHGIDAGAAGFGGPASLASLRELFQAAISHEHHAFLASLQDRHREGDYGFVHAGVRPGVPFAQQATGDVISVRTPFLESTEDHGPVIVHGHTIADTPQLRPNRIGIDTGAYRSGILTCLVLQGCERSFLQTGASARGSRSSSPETRSEVA